MNIYRSNNNKSFRPERPRVIGGAYLPMALVAGLFVVAAHASGQSPPADGGQRVSVAELTPQAEAAIEKGLQYLSTSTKPGGGWGDGNRAAITSLSLMAFMVKGDFPDRPPYGQQMTQGLKFLIKQQNREGYIGNSMYEHGLSTLVLSEIWGMSRQDDVGDALKKAVAVILRSQNPQGGWRYQPQPNDADLSITVMQVVALASAKEAGIVVPDKTVQKAIEYVRLCHDAKSGGFCYQPNSGPGFARTAAGSMALTMCGQRNSQEVTSGLDYLEKQPEGQFESCDGHFFYAHYYAAQAMFQAGDERYQKWYPRIRESLLKKQAANGSWPDPNGIGTPAAILVLGIPYRFLPIYQR